MRPRQALLTAAALLPAALLTGTAAHATDAPTPTPTPTPTTASGSPSVSASVSASPSPSASPPSASPTPPTSPTPPAQPPYCPGDDEDENLLPTLTGLPGHITAGSGWHSFTLEVENATSTAIEDVEVAVSRAAWDNTPEVPAENNAYVDVQYRDAKTRAWEDVPFPDDFSYGDVATADLVPRGKLKIQLRLRIDEDIVLGDRTDPNHHGGYGYLMGVAEYLDEAAACMRSYPTGYGWFEIQEPGTGTGDGTPSAPPTGNAPAPQTGGGTGTTPTATPATSTTPTGNLAETGSSSALPVLALAGGAAVAVGAGAVYAVRRRKGSATGRSA